MHRGQKSSEKSASHFTARKLIPGSHFLFLLFPRSSGIKIKTMERRNITHFRKSPTRGQGGQTRKHLRLRIKLFEKFCAEASKDSKYETNQIHDSSLIDSHFSRVMHWPDQSHMLPLSDTPTSPPAPSVGRILTINQQRDTAGGRAF